MYRQTNKSSDLAAKTVLKKVPSKEIADEWASDILSWSASNYSRELAINVLKKASSPSKNPLFSLNANGELRAVSLYSDEDTGRIHRMFFDEFANDDLLDSKKDAFSFLHAAERTGGAIYINLLAGHGRGGGKEIIEWYLSQDKPIYLHALEDAMSFYAHVGMKPFGDTSTFFYVPDRYILESEKIYDKTKQFIATKLSIILTDLTKALIMPVVSDNKAVRYFYLKTLHKRHYDGMRKQAIENGEEMKAIFNEDIVKDVINIVNSLKALADEKSVSKQERDIKSLIKEISEIISKFDL